jgi:hypothetical protein
MLENLHVFGSKQKMKRLYQNIFYVCQTIRNGPETFESCDSQLNPKATHFRARFIWTLLRVLTWRTHFWSLSAPFNCTLYSSSYNISNNPQIKQQVDDVSIIHAPTTPTHRLFTFLRRVMKYYLKFLLLPNWIWRKYDQS